MLPSALKEYVVLRVDGGGGFQRELVAESALEGEAVRVARMLSEVADASTLYERGVCYEVRLSGTGSLLESFPVFECEYPEEAEEGRLLEFPMCFAVA